MKLTYYGAPEPAATQQLSKEDEHGAVLARRAQRGDYDDGELLYRRIIPGIANALVRLQGIYCSLQN